MDGCVRGVGSPWAHGVVDMSKNSVLHVLLPSDLYAAIRAIAKDAGLTIKAWVIISLRSSVRNWDAGFDSRKRKRKVGKPGGYVKWPSGWPQDQPCWVCQVKHEPLEHSTVTEEDIAMMLREVV